jgi:hypothetical protein
MSESNNDVFYAFYDKTKETQNNGWVWFHRKLAVKDILTNFYRDYLQERNKDILATNPSNNRGFVRFDNWKVLFGFYPAPGKDDRGRDHNWVLLTAWTPADGKQSRWEIFDGNIFKHVAGGDFKLPNELSKFDYDVKIVKLTYEGAKATIPADKNKDSKWYVDEIEKRGVVDVIFYRENPDGSADIETKKTVTTTATSSDKK